MRVNRYSFVVVLSLVLTIGLTTAFAGGGDDKRPKDTGILSVRTAGVSYPVKIDGQVKGMSGVSEGAEFYLAPGTHTVEVDGPNGAIFTKEIEIRRGEKHCLCLKTVETVTKHPCPYDFHLEGPDKIQEGDIVTFAAINSGTAPIPIRYAWSVQPSDLRIVSGQGTPSITIDSRGMGGRTIDAQLDVNDDVYDNKCRQSISVPTDVSRLDIPKPPTAFKIDEFVARTHDEDKARFDNAAIQVQNTPDSQLYIIVYPGTDKISMTRNTYDRLQKLTLDYMIKTRGVDPRRITIIKGSGRTTSTFEMWIVPPGAQPPVTQ